jgi:outer membrane lipase/esterase
VQAGANGLVSLGVAYMTALANQLADSVTANGIDKGAMRVAILNVPDITKTPRFIAVLKQVSDASGGGAVGAATAAQVSGIANLWVNAFNTQLNARFKDNAKVQMLDFYTWFNVWLSKPADYGITNTTEPACPGPINVCTATALDAIAGKTAGWWKSYSFSDSFHGTPATNKLMADNVLYLLNKKGWY